VPAHGFHLFDEPVCVFANQTAVSHVLKNFAGEGIALRFQFLDARRKLFVHGSLDAVTDMHIGILKNAVICLLPDQASVLVLPAFPRRLGIFLSLFYPASTPHL